MCDFIYSYVEERSSNELMIMNACVSINLFKIMENAIDWSTIFTKDFVNDYP